MAFLLEPLLLSPSYYVSSVQMSSLSLCPGPIHFISLSRLSTSLRGSELRKDRNLCAVSTPGFPSVWPGPGWWGLGNDLSSGCMEWIGAAH